MYYGQFEPPTDKVIEEFFPGKTFGTAIEIGAAQGVAASNTLHFEQIGWKCICIEPNPSLFSQLKQNRKIALNYAISDFNADNQDFTVVSIGGVEETAVSSLSIEKQLYEAHGSPPTRLIKVNVRTLDKCLEDVGYFIKKLPRVSVDFISIDTEGTELDVIKGIDFSSLFSPTLLVIENNFDAPDIANYLRPFGYKKVKRHVINDFYTR